MLDPLLPSALLERKVCLVRKYQMCRFSRYELSLEQTSWERTIVN